MSEAREVDGTGTVAAEDRLKAQIVEEREGGPVAEAGSSGIKKGSKDIPIDESKFIDDEDLGELDKELEDLKVWPIAFAFIFLLSERQKSIDFLCYNWNKSLLLTKHKVYFMYSHLDVISVPLGRIINPIQPDFASF